MLLPIIISGFPVCPILRSGHKVDHLKKKEEEGSSFSTFFFSIGRDRGVFERRAAVLLVNFPRTQPRPQTPGKGSTEKTASIHPGGTEVCH